MLKILVTGAVYMVCLFILVLVSCLMIWVITRLLRWLFPQRFGPRPDRQRRSPRRSRRSSVSRMTRTRKKMRNTDRSSLPGVRSGKCVTQESSAQTDAARK